MKKYSLDNTKNLLKSLKHNTPKISSDFTNSVMDRITKDVSINDNAELEDIDDMLYNLSINKEIIPDENFTKNVINRIKNSQQSYYTEENIDEILSILKNTSNQMPSNNFTENVIDRIKLETVNENITSFEKVYKKFVIGSICVAAAAVLLALNLFNYYDAAVAEYMVTDYFNTGIY